MTNPAAGHAQATLSGRELALQRRQAMALRGKSAANPAPAAHRAPRVEPAVAAVVSSRDTSTASVAQLPAAAFTVASNPARARRQALSQRGKAAVGAAGVPAARLQQSAASVSTSGYSQPAAAAAPAAACQGGSACSCGGAAAAAPAAALPPVQLAQGRRAAMQRRQALARQGGQSQQAARPSGRVRPREQAAAPAKVEEGHTLSGQRVTGTQVERSTRVTGNEPGSCRAVTGTEYIGAEQFDRLCTTRPAAAAPKVLGARTELGQSFTGTLLDRPARVTGGEQGADRAVTGTRYLAAGVDPAPAKVELTHTSSGRSVTGTRVEQGRRATGAESGACRPVTGTEYLSLEHFESVCSSTPPAQPRKVSVMSSRDGERVTGSSVGRGVHVTGNETGAARAVTGNQYFNVKDFGAAMVAAVARAEGGARPKSLGDERQGCTRVTAVSGGSIQARPAVRSEPGRSMTIAARAITGDRPGGGGMPTTGDERGACEPVTGTPYMGEDNRPAFCAAPPPAAVAGQPQTFSILTPGHAALGRERGRGVTGSAMGTERITGPGNKAEGLITGTPEFRRHEPRPPREVAPAAAAEGAPRGAERLSGEGSQQGPRISGDVWMDRSRVTGTEGPSALSRNPSLRGQPRGAGSSATAPREADRPQVPPSRVTGSSGNSERGAVVTVSGGARG